MYKYNKYTCLRKRYERIILKNILQNNSKKIRGYLQIKK